MPSGEKLVLKKHKKLGKIYQDKSMLVFKSATERLVVGRIEDDQFIPLDEKAVELCEEYGHEVDKSLLDEAEADVQEEVEEKEIDAEESVEPLPEPVVEPPSKAKKEKKEKPEETPKKKAVVPPKVLDFSSVLMRHSEELIELNSSLTKKEEESTQNKERVAELEKELETMKKDHEETKKKLKGVLLAMQNSL